jgi:hypothetical protein
VPSVPSVIPSIKLSSRNSAQAATEVFDNITAQYGYGNSRGGYVALAKVISCSPTTGVYRISVGAGILNAYAGLSTHGSSRICGTKEVVNYTPGTDVLVVIPGADSDPHLIPTILGACNIVPLDPETPHLFSYPLEFHSKGGISALGRVDHKEQIQGEAAYEHMRRNYSYGRPLDVVPGEWAQVNGLSGGILLNDFYAGMRGSSGCGVECFALDNSVRISADIFCQSNAAYDDRTFYDRFSLSSVQGWAASINEGLGGLTKNALENKGYSVDQPTFGPADPAQRGFFGITQATGYLADGQYLWHRVPGTSTTTYTEDSPVVPALLAVEHRPDGACRIRAAKEISLVKTIYIPSPKEKKDSDLEDTSEENPFDRKQWNANNDPVSEISIFGKSALDAYDEYEVVHNSLGGIQTKDYWAVDLSKSDVYSRFNETYGASFQPDFSLQALPEEAPFYVTPAREVTVRPFVDADGKRTDEVKLFDISSAIRQLEDGSIVISAGYGEEIRFHKGNIYLSCPGDIIETVGRDKVTFAGRHNVQKACKGMLELTSDNSVAIAAAGNIQVTAAASGRAGTMLIENRSREWSNVKAFEDGGALSKNQGEYGGVVIRSESNVAVMSKHNVLSHAGNFDGSITQVCSESVLGNIKYASLNIERNGFLHVLAMSGGSIAFGRDLELLCNSASIGTGSLVLSKADAEISARDASGGTVPVRITSSTPRLMCKGPASFTTLFSTVASLDSVATTSGSVGKQAAGSKYPAGSYQQSQIAASVGDLSTPSQIQSKYDIFIQAMNNSLDNLKLISTVFPESSGYMSSGFFLPLGAWQLSLSGGARWNEMKVVRSNGSASMPFPGKSVWEGKGLKAFEDGKVVDKNLSKDLVINTTMQKTGV